MGGWLWQLGGMGHEAVVFFFVLSGYVISYVTESKEKSLRDYALNRAARIYSVALPAILLTLLLYYLGNYINEAAFADLNQRLINPVVTTLAALLFFNQSWLSITIFSNMPYWSLGYEVLYYALFGIFLFVHGRKKFPLAALVLIIMGPSVILYLPIWLLGVASHRVSNRINSKIALAPSVFILSTIAIAILCLGPIQYEINHYVHGLFSDRFLSLLNEPAENFGADYCLAIALAINIAAFSKIGEHRVIFNEKIGRAVRGLASYTFSIYLYHMPILFFIAAIAPYEKHALTNISLCLIATPLIIFLLGSVTEKKKGVFKQVIAASSRSLRSKVGRH